jgi:hypothetical protein
MLGMGIWTWGREEEGGTPGPAWWARINRIEGCTGACWRWRSLPEPASMLDLDGPLSRRTGGADPCAGGTAPGARTGGERGTISLFQSRRGLGSKWSPRRVARGGEGFRAR